MPGTVKSNSMIQKIICPVDFSDASINATEHASQLAKVFNAELLLINVEKKVAPLALAGQGPESNIRENSRRLKEMGDLANKTFNISVRHEVTITSRSLEHSLASMGNENTLIVMGTNGVDTLSQFYLGTNTYNVVKKAHCPVLLIPEGAPYSSYKNIVYALVYNEKGKLALAEFREFAKAFNARVTFMHVSEKDTDISREVFSVVKREVDACFGDKENTFVRVFSDEPSVAITEFMANAPGDLLVVAARHRNVIESIFKKRPLLSVLSEAPPCPILVLYS